MFRKKAVEIPHDKLEADPEGKATGSSSGKSFASGMLRLSTIDKNRPEMKSLRLKTAPDGTVSTDEVLRAAEIEETTEFQLKRNKKRSLALMCVTISLTLIGVAIGSSFLASYLSAAMGVRGGNLVKHGTDTLILTAPVGIRMPISELPSLHTYDRKWLSAIIAVSFRTADDVLHYFRVFQYDIVGGEGGSIELQSSFGKSLIVSAEKMYMIDQSGTQTAVLNSTTEIISGAFYPFENYCKKKPCNANAICANMPNAPKCTCLTGFSGDGLTCTADNPCASQPCASTAKCTAKGTDFSCECNAGYKGDGKACEDVDECKDPKLNNCNPVNGTCTNTAGSYSCACVPGFNGNGVECSSGPSAAPPLPA